jgi:multicopper oxidase
VSRGVVDGLCQDRTVEWWQRSFSRRDALVRTGGIGIGASLFALTGCDAAEPTVSRKRAARRKITSGSMQEFRLIAEPGEVELGPDVVYRTWLYNGRFPGPEIRVREGDRIKVRVENGLPEAGTTVHWHGIPVPNAMDGVPKLTQEPIPPDQAMIYEYDAAPAGSYMYHSHMDLQLDRGLLGALIIEERSAHIAYDHEEVLVFDDYLPDPPRSLAEMARSATRESGGMMGGMMGRSRSGGMMGGMSGIVPPYAALLINGKLPSDPAQITVRSGDRIRLRLINPSSATTYRIAIAGHTMLVTHADGQPVEPVKVDRLTLGMGERYDVLIEAGNPGIWPLVGVAVEGDVQPARAVLRYVDARASTISDGLPRELTRGRALAYSDLRSVDGSFSARDPDRIFNLRLSGGMMMRPDVWTIGGEAYPDAAPLEIREGELVRVNMTNMSMMLHPMHLHGHFFHAGNALKDTLIVEPHMGRASFDFVADNPGRWLFHCHNLYHLHAGMAREFRYV